MFSRLASHRCPSCGCCLQPTLKVAAEQELVCPDCGTSFYAPSAEELAFNSQGAYLPVTGPGPSGQWTALLVPDETLTIDQGAWLPGTPSCGRL